MTEKTKTLVQRMMQVRRAVDHITKDAQNQGQRFNYASSVAVLTELRKQMNDAGILMLSEVSAHSIGDIETKSGSKQIVTHLDMVYTFVNEDSPLDRLIMKWYAQGIDTSEKGPGKAATYAEKYFLLKTFNIPTPNEDPDADPEPEQRAPGNSYTARSDNGIAMVTEAQQGMIFAIGEKLWGTAAKVEYPKFAAENSWPMRTSDLSKSQASAVISALQSQNGEDPSQ